MLQCWERRRGDPPVIANSKVSDAAKRTFATGSYGSEADSNAPCSQTAAIGQDQSFGPRL